MKVIFTHLGSLIQEKYKRIVWTSQTHCFPILGILVSGCFPKIRSYRSGNMNKQAPEDRHDVYIYIFDIMALFGGYRDSEFHC